MTSSHSLDRLSVQFDEDNLVADAGLLLPATLAQHLGLADLFSRGLRGNGAKVAKKSSSNPN